MAAPHCPSPRVAIGLPVYNGAATLATALDALLSQDFHDFELTIADNASIDTTGDIARAYVKRDPRVRYVRHPQNLGAFPNFAYLLNTATAPLFMWAASDDRWSPDFLSLAVAALDADPDCVSAVCPVHFEGQSADPVRMGDGLLGASRLAERVAEFISCWHANSVFYSVFRRAALARSINPAGDYLGFDWTVMLRVTAVGRSVRLDNGWMERGTRGLSSDPKLLRTSRSHPVHWLLPLYDFASEALRVIAAEPLSARLAVFAALARLNAHGFRLTVVHDVRKLMQWSGIHPRRPRARPTA